jgi:hypothetical protein
MDDGNDDFVRGAEAIAAVIGELITDGPKPTARQVYHWSATHRIRVGRLGPDLIATRGGLREDLARAAQPPSPQDSDNHPPPQAMSQRHPKRASRQRLSRGTDSVRPGLGAAVHVAGPSAPRPVRFMRPKKT